MAGNKANIGGFSLLEALIAMSVLAVGLLGLAGLFETGTKALQIGNKNALASQLAKNKMEALRSSRMKLPLRGADPSEEGIVTTWEVRPGAKDPALLLIAVESRWRGAQNKEERFLLKSLFYAD